MSLAVLMVVVPRWNEVVHDMRHDLTLWVKQFCSVLTD